MSEPVPITLRLSDGYETFARLWIPAAARGAVLYLHGIQSHGGWFLSSARRLAEAGYIVLLPDRRGSGRNERDRGHAPSARRLLRDCRGWLDVLRTGQVPGGPSFAGFVATHIVGVSWGGKLALALARQDRRSVASITLVAPGLFPQVDLPFRDKLRVAWAALVARRRRFPIPLDDPALFTANRDRQRFIREDPLALRQVTAAFLLASRRLDSMARKAACVRAGPPLCLFIAGRDRIIRNAATKDFVRRLDWPGRHIIEYPEAEHTLEFELNPEPYLKDLVTWVSNVESPLEAALPR